MSTELEKNLPQVGQPQLTPEAIASRPYGASKQERRRLKKERQREERTREQRKRTVKKAMRVALVILVAGGAIFGFGWFITTRPSLPPTSMQGHTEDMPSAHTVDTPIPDSMQKHMLEHADGRGKPGVIIQYNCQKYTCEPDLVTKLTELVKQYPDNVYLAPNRYDGKIILTKLGKIQILDAFDEQMIKKFVE